MTNQQPLFELPQALYVYLQCGAIGLAAKQRHTSKGLGELSASDMKRLRSCAGVDRGETAARVVDLPQGYCRNSMEEKTLRIWRWSCLCHATTVHFSQLAIFQFVSA